MRSVKAVHLLLWAVAAAVFVVTPFVLDPAKSYLVFFAFTALTHVALAQSWNIIGGYAGQISLGTHAFFGVGAYVIAITWSRGLIGYLDPVGIVGAGCVAAIIAILVGLPLLSKLKGDYFALGTLGLGEILRLLTIQGRGFTGGPTGIMLPSSSFTTIMPHYYIALLIAAFAVILSFYIRRSRVGLALITIRDTEPAAAPVGINVLKYKVLAFAASAFIVGLCGAIQAYYVFQVEPNGFFSLDWTLFPTLMCSLGGAGTLSGPVIGAVFLTAIFELTKQFLPTVHPVFSGLLIILAILFVPSGFLGMKLKRLRHGRSAVIETTSTMK